MRRRLDDETGSVSAFVAVIAVSLIMVAGLVYDGGQVLAAQATARDLAANAARAGAQELDLDVLRTEGAARLDAERASFAALEYLRVSGVEGSVRVDGPTITVTALVPAQMRILPVPDRTVRASDTATATPGVTEGDAPDA